MQASLQSMRCLNGVELGVLLYKSFMSKIIRVIYDFLLRLAKEFPTTRRFQKRPRNHIEPNLGGLHRCAWQPDVNR